MSDTTDYQKGYQAGIRCEECPDDASVSWHLGYGAALGIPEGVLAMAADNLLPIRPGRLLRKDLDALGLTETQFADLIKVPHQELADVLSGNQPVTASLASRLSRAFGTTAQYWLNLQAIFDLKTAHDTPIYEGPVDDLLDGPGAFADGLRAAYETAKRIIDRDHAAGVAANAIIDNVLAELAGLAGMA